jgi:hypothetical protein
MSEDPVGAYLRDLDAALAVVPGPARARAAIVAEIGGGLTDAVADLLAGGCPGAEAGRRAVAEFGPPRLVAAEFVPVLVAAQVRRCALALLRTGPLVGTLWLLAAACAQRAALPLAWPVVLAAGAVVAVALAAAVPCTLFAVAVTGPAGRRRVDDPRPASWAALVAVAGAIVGDAVLLTALATQAPALLAGPGRVGSGPALAVLAAAASLTRLTLAVRGAALLRRTRTALADSPSGRPVAPRR